MVTARTTYNIRKIATRVVVEGADVITISVSHLYFPLVGIYNI